jgi:dolichol kinase
MRRACLAILILLAGVLFDARKAPVDALFLTQFCYMARLADPNYGTYRSPGGGQCGPGERLVTGSGTALMSRPSRGDQMAFWIALALPLALFFVAAYLLGRGVVNRGWNANDTRKALGVIMFAVPPLVPFMTLGANAVPAFAVLGYVSFLLALLIFVAPLRQRSTIIATAFAALDRPEDRPFTLLWLVSAYIASALIFFVAALGPFPIHPVLLIAMVLAITLGDIAAGVVGRHFGRHTYQTIGLGASQRYVRTFEGSAAMLAVALASVAYVTMGHDSDMRLLALLILPLTLTLAEALSPHTWDEPIMYAAGVAGCVVVQMLAV